MQDSGIMRLEREGSGDRGRGAFFHLNNVAGAETGFKQHLAHELFDYFLGAILVSINPDHAPLVGFSKN